VQISTVSKRHPCRTFHTFIVYVFVELQPGRILRCEQVPEELKEPSAARTPAPPQTAETCMLVTKVLSMVRALLPYCPEG
jgi:hypothetical protein